MLCAFMAAVAAVSVRHLTMRACTPPKLKTAQQKHTR